MSEARTSFTELLLGVTGFLLGGAISAFVAQFIAMSFLARAAGGIHSDWTPVVMLGTLACIVIGGIAGAIGAVRLAKSRRD
jgi:hypothetical protein